MRFPGLGLGDRVPDAKTIWLFREQLVQAKAIEKLFARFDDALHGAGYLAMGGQIIDATVVAAPRQKLSDEEKAAIRAVPRHRPDQPESRTGRGQDYIPLRRDQNARRLVRPPPAREQWCRASP